MAQHNITTVEQLIEYGRSSEKLTLEMVHEFIAHSSSDYKTDRLLTILLVAALTSTMTKTPHYSRSTSRWDSQMTICLPKEENTSTPLDDIVRIYLRDMGKINLLSSRQGEIMIAMRIEAGTKQVLQRYQNYRPALN